MLLGGLWHGAGAAYVLWGLYHGLLLVMHRAWQHLVDGRREAADKEAAPHPVAQSWLPKYLGKPLLVVVFFHLTCVGWLLFRAGALPREFSQVKVVSGYLQAMVHFPLASGVSPLAGAILVLGGLALFLQWQHRLMDRFSQWPVPWQAGGVVCALATIAALGVFEGAQFIYFQF
jgi:D-alanyl-lipoteichoic acid acyltransferase DltB (MBOAT superfamily)